MKIIITESQYENVANRFKRILFKYWDINGPTLSRQIYKLMGIDSYHSYKLEPFFQGFLVEWIGGDEKFTQFLKKNEGETFQIIDGGYNFQIILDEVTVNEYQVYLHVRVIPGGTVTLIFDEGQPTIPLEEALKNDKYGWEINSEVTEVVHNKFFKFYSDLGITIEDIDIDYM
jgi:hypothetical protein